MASAMASAWWRMACFGFGFDHDAREGFGAGVADDDAAALVELCFGGANGSSTVGIESSGFFSRTLTLTMTCGKTFRSAMSSSSDLPVRRDEIEDDEGGEQAVAGGGEVREEDVARLLAAERSACSCCISFENVAVADGSAQHANADRGGARLRGPCSTWWWRRRVAVAKQVARLQVASGDQQDGVAVDDVAVRVGEHAAVGIAVEGDAEVGSAGFCFRGDKFRMQCAAFGVDVAAVGR